MRCDVVPLLIYKCACLGMHMQLHLAHISLSSYHYMYDTEFGFILLFKIFRTDRYCHVLIMPVKCGVHADE